MPLTFILAALVAQAATAQESSQDSIEGRWRSPGGNSIIAIAPCGSSLCGTVDWASDKAKQDAAKVTDQLIGTQLLTGLQERKPGRWQGKLFIPDRNMRVTAKLQLVSSQQLKVSGCAAAVLCSSQIWNRFDETLPE
jgi:uncharacterized protein (DUF2147 family)